MEQLTNGLKERLLSRKFMFSIFAFIVISGMLYFDKLPPSYYEGIAVSIILTYLGSNVAYKYVDEKGKVAMVKEKTQENTNDDTLITPTYTETYTEEYREPIADTQVRGFFRNGVKNG